MKPTSVYRCQACGFQTGKWYGRCPDCSEFNTMVEERTAPAPGGRRRAGAPGGPATARPLRLAEVAAGDAERLRTGIAELDRVLGGGVVPGSLVLIGGDPGIGKCVTGDTRLLDPVTGAYLPITEWRVHGRHVVALNDERFELRPSTVSAFHERGVQPTVEVRTALGRTLRCTPEHPVLTPEGWQPVSTLQVGSRIAAPRALPHFGHDALPDSAIKLIAYILSDGSAQSAVTVTTSLVEVEQDLHEIAAAFNVRLVAYDKPRTRARQYRFATARGTRLLARREFAAALWRVKASMSTSWQAWARRAGVSYGLLNAWRRGRCVPDGQALECLARAAGVSVTDLAARARNRADEKTAVARFLEDVGVRFARAAEKSVPQCVFRLPRKELALFLRTLFTCDGSVYVNRSGQAGVSYSTISRRLAEDVAHLLLRFGFVTTIRRKRLRISKMPYLAYEVVLLGLPEARRFLDTIGIAGRQAAQKRIMAMRPARLPSTRRDTIPTGAAFWSCLRSATGGATFAAISRCTGRRFKNRRHERPLCRSTVIALANAYPHPRLHAVAHGAVYWDDIVSVTLAGDAEVYDITVPVANNFVANDLIVHNSTLLIQTCGALADVAGPVLYVSGEESAAQVKLRADRLGLGAPGTKDLFILSETALEAIEAQVASIVPRVLVVDSIQTVHLGGLESAPGSVSQVRECGGRLMALAKTTGLAVFLAGHVTKEGAIAGPRVLEHLVDTVLYFEGERHATYRILRAVKNRFGSTNEIGVFEMTGRGLAEVANPSAVFLAERPRGAPGSVIVVALEGTRPLLLELQALVSPAHFGTPRRTVLGADYNRVCLLLAVLEKRAGFPLQTQDVFVNVAGGARCQEPAADLGIVIAAASSYTERALAPDVVLLGEVGLTGEIRAIGGLEARLAEAAALGFRSAVVPRGSLGPEMRHPLEVRGVATLEEALSLVIG